ncbi:MAG: hypothetical protein ACKOFW_21900 [Planctomycetaceae bacterium]
MLRGVDHAPALYFAAWPAFALCGPTLPVLWVLRGFMWLLTGLTALRLARPPRIAPCSPTPDPHAFPTVDSLAGLFFLGTTVAVAKGLEFRPDVPATCLLAWVAWLTLDHPDPARFRGPRSPGSPDMHRLCHPPPQVPLYALLVALCAGLATLFTQKAIVPLAALSAALTLQGLVTREWRAVLWRIVPITFGVAIAWIATGLLFACLGAGPVFFDSTIAQLWRWPLRSGTWPHLRPTLAADGWFWALALLGACHQLAPWLPPLRRSPPTPPPHQPPAPLPPFPTLAVASLLCVASLGVVKATFPQFYLLWFPWLALLAPAGWTRLQTLLATPSRSPLPRLALAACSLLSLATLARGVFQGPLGSLAPLFQPSPTRSLALLLLLTGAVLLALAVVRSQPRFVSTLLALTLACGLARHASLLAWHNQPQVAAIEELHARVPPSGRVLDGFTGWGALRPHAYYHWWLNPFSLALLPPDQLETELLDLFRHHPPAALLDDAELQRLPASVRAEIEAHYQPTPPAPLRLHHPN